VPLTQGKRGSLEREWQNRKGKPFNQSLQVAGLYSEFSDDIHERSLIVKGQIAYIVGGIDLNCS
jgi:hypothetical protein